MATRGAATGARSGEEEEAESADAVEKAGDSEPANKSCERRTSTARPGSLVWIRDDGSAIWRNWGWEGLSYVVAPAQIVALPDSEVYTQCLADASDQARFSCLSQSLADERDPVCDEGWQTEGI